MRCPDCNEDLDVDIMPDYSKVMCWNCFFEVERKFESPDEAFRFLEENKTERTQK